MSPTRTHYRTCNLCEAMCGIAIKLDGDRILSIQGDKDDVFSQGHICPKAVALQDIHNDPDRLRQPVRRTSQGWQTIGWREAFDEVARNLKSVQSKYGNDAVAVYQGNPTVHNYGTMLFAPRFVRALATRNRFSATSADQLPHHFAAYFMFGHYLLLPIPDVDHTDFFLILGANPLASNGSMMTAPGIERRLKKLKQRDGKLVVIDPRRTETAALADQHLFIRPGSDALLLLAMIYTLYDENLVGPGRLREIVDGFELIQGLVSEFSPERVEAAVGIKAPVIKQLAREFAAAKSAVCYGRTGVSMQSFGAVTHWLINLLNILTGNLDRPGGAMFTTPAVDALGSSSKKKRNGHFDKWRSRVRGVPEFSGELPVSVMAEEILTQGKGQIRALVTSAGNPVLSTPNGANLESALAQLDFMVSIDIFINETTRHANIILPPATGLETDHYDLVFHLLAVRNTARFSPALFQPAKGSMHDWQIFKELQKRLTKEKGRTPLAALASLPDRIMTPGLLLDLGLRLGPHGVWNRSRTQNNPRLSLRKLKHAEHGIDLGPLQQCLPERLFTSNKRIQLAPEVFLKDLKRVKSNLLDAQNQNNGFDMRLIGRRDLRSNNSWMHNSNRLVKGKDRCTLLLNPVDARAKKITDGQQVKVTSRVGSLVLKAEFSEEMMPGVVSIPHGWGHHRQGTQLQIAQEHAGVSANDLTDEQELDLLCGNAVFNGVPVRVVST